MEFDFALAQDIGTRSEQQDSAAVCPFDRVQAASGGALFVIADGLGGHTGGARASHIVVKTFADAGESGRFKSPKDRYEQLGAALAASNDEIAAAARSLAKNETMGTTLVAAAAAWNSVGWISVGDSHLYLWRAGVVTKLNEDHSQAGQMIKSGRYKADDPELDAYRSMLRSAIMGRELTLIDRPIETMAIQHGDILVLATDGLNVVDIQDIEKMIAAGATGSSEALAEVLLDAVRTSGVESRDNATVIVARVTALDGETKAAGPGETAITAGHADDGITTAIVTTPFYKTGQPGQTMTQRLRASALSPQGVVEKVSAPRDLDAVQSSTATKPVAELRKAARAAQAEAADVPQAVDGGGRRNWAILALAAAAAAAAIAWLAYQKFVVRG
jgi:PPM family protein phosphatase